jgi:hypothetical protein
MKSKFRLLFACNEVIPYPCIWLTFHYYSHHLRGTNHKCVDGCFVPPSSMMFRRWWRCGVPWRGDLLVGVPITRLPVVLLCFLKRVVFSLYVITQYTCNNVLFVTLVLSKMLYFWPYVWQLDPRRTYDEHLVLALKPGVTKWDQSCVNCRNASLVRRVL